MLQVLNNPDGSSSTALPLGRLNPPNLIPLTATASASGPLVASSNPAPSSASASQFDPTDSGLTGAASNNNNNNSTAVSPLSAAPLAPNLPLPAINVTQTVLGDPSAGTSGSDLNSGVLPQNTPEPSSFAVFGMLFLASVLGFSLRRLQPRE
jgi:hypothetical protein